MDIRHQTVTRYIVPLREGGSLPALAEADDGFKYVVKFSGAGHGKKALIAELIGGLFASVLGLKVPELVLLSLGQEFGITEADEEVQDLLRASSGINIGLHYLDGAFTMDPYINPVDAELASKIVWLDAFLTNVDRTARNTNMLLWHNSEIWLIDHGASLYFHHSWSDVEKAALSPFQYISQHALLHKASMLDEIDNQFRSKLANFDFHQITDLIPDEWLIWDGIEMSPAEIGEVYYRFLTLRLRNSKIFTKEAIDARRKSLI